MSTVALPTKNHIWKSNSHRQQWGFYFCPKLLGSDEMPLKWNLIYRHTSSRGRLLFHCFTLTPISFIIWNAGPTQINTIITRGAGGSKASHAFLCTHSTACRQSGLLLNIRIWKNANLTHNVRLKVWKSSSGLEMTGNIPMTLKIPLLRRNSVRPACEKWTEVHTSAGQLMDFKSIFDF